MDADFDTALQIAKLISPGTRFTFSILKAKDDDQWVIALIQDRQDRTERSTFAQGSAATQDEAIKKLVLRLHNLASTRIDEVTELARKAADRYAAELEALGKAYAIPVPALPEDAAV